MSQPLPQAIKREERGSKIQQNLDTPSQLLKSCARLMMCVERLNRPRLGKTSSGFFNSNHSAIGTIKLSQGYLGMTLPRPAS
mmetsp:Transcript_128058/g.255720  ORF Transcript_128058/g.255720 Transcript_128058/m.255720 type:complete len:82 (+) Transcript_128058:518-763(+)